MKLRLLAITALMLLGTACQGIVVGVEAELTGTPAEAVASQTPETAGATTAAPLTQHPLAGLVYTIGAGNGLWRIGADGARLAWKVYGNSQSGVVVMDLAQGGAQLLHPYTIIGGSEIYAELAWSPDGQWLAVVNQAERTGEHTSLWALRADGSEEHYLGGLASAPVWSPDSQSLVYTQLPTNANADAFDAARVLRVEAGQWRPQALELPGGAQVMQWTRPVQ